MAFKSVIICLLTYMQVMLILVTLIATSTHGSLITNGLPNFSSVQESNQMTPVWNVTHQLAHVVCQLRTLSNQRN